MFSFKTAGGADTQFAKALAYTEYFLDYSLHHVTDVPPNTPRLLSRRLRRGLCLLAAPADPPLGV
jgi:hypothetical protein